MTVAAMLWWMLAGIVGMRLVGWTVWLVCGRLDAPDLEQQARRRPF